MSRQISRRGPVGRGGSVIPNSDQEERQRLGRLQRPHGTGPRRKYENRNEQGGGEPDLLGGLRGEVRPDETGEGTGLGEVETHGRAPFHDGRRAVSEVEAVQTTRFPPPERCI
jgi:hypothetical protein